MLTNNRRSFALVLAFLTFFHASGALAFELNSQDEELLLKIQKDTFQYFLRMSDKETGLTRDSSQSGSPASIAATGFSLAAFAIAHHRSWIDREYAYAYLEKTLKTLLYKAEHKKGFFYHFLDPRSAKRTWASEASTIDTALLIAGALLAAQYFPDTKIEEMAYKIYARADWAWMLNQSSNLICMGWKPESGFLPYYWDSYNELIILQALAIGSPTHAVSQDVWQAWFRNEDEYRGKPVVYSYSGSLFTYQYAQAFIDFRQLDDHGINYFQNSINATLANREYSLSHQLQHKSYTPQSWGLTASLGPGGYRAYGGKPGEGLHDGTIAPSAAIGSIVFTPDESLQAIRYFYTSYPEQLYGRFGFKDAFNLDKGWFAHEYLGIDQGISLLMLENFLQEGFLWEKFMQLVPIQRWIKLCRLLRDDGRVAATAPPATSF